MLKAIFKWLKDQNELHLSIILEQNQIWNPFMLISMLITEIQKPFKFKLLVQWRSKHIKLLNIS